MSQKKARSFEAGLGERSRFKKLGTYLFFLAAFFFAGISEITSSPEFFKLSKQRHSLGLSALLPLYVVSIVKLVKTFLCRIFAFLEASNGSAPLPAPRPAISLCEAPRLLQAPVQFVVGC